jgi:hypothetical protein
MVSRLANTCTQIPAPLHCSRTIDRINSARLWCPTDQLVQTTHASATTAAAAATTVAAAAATVAAATVAAAAAAVAAAAAAATTEATTAAAAVTTALLSCGNVHLSWMVCCMHSLHAGSAPRIYVKHALP